MPLLLAIPGLAVSAQTPVEPLQLDQSQEELSLSGHLELFEDPSSKLSLRELFNPDVAAKFQRIPGSVLRMDNPGSTYWLRFSLNRNPKTPTATAKKWTLELGWPFFPMVWFYLMDDQGDLSMMRSGYWPIDAPEVPWLKKPSFSLEGISPGRSTVYVQIRTDGGMPVPLKLHTHEKAASQASLRMLLLGIYYGVLLAIILYNLSMFFFLRQIRYLWFVLSIFFLAMHYIGFNAVAYDYFSAPLDLLFRHEGSLLWMALSLLCIGLFAKRFLLVKEYSPLSGKILNLHIGLWLLMPILIFSLPAGILDSLMFTLGGLSVIPPVLAGLLCWRKGFKPARFFLLAWAFSAMGGILFSLTMSGALPYSIMGAYAIQIGTALEFLLFSLALADQIRLLRKQRDTYQRGQRRFQALSMTDSLTKLYNKRFLLEELPGLMRGAVDAGQDLSVAVMDLDDFKAFNDTHGHLAGDKVLAGFAGVIKGCLREQDLACRFGGEEFVIILPGSGLEGARQVTDRILKGLAQQTFDSGASGPVQVTVSAGLALMRPGDNHQALLQRADQALYQAKAAGKNRIASAELAAV